MISYYIIVLSHHLVASTSTILCFYMSPPIKIPFRPHETLFDPLEITFCTLLMCF